MTWKLMCRQKCEENNIALKNSTAECSLSYFNELVLVENFLITNNWEKCWHTCLLHLALTEDHKIKYK